MKSNFNRCMAQVFLHEGGYVNNAQDPGGETNFGISKRSYPNEDIRGMTRERAAKIYRRDYWNPVRGDDLPAGIDLVAFDAAVNSGVSRGAKWLQQALGVAADGRVGPNTIEAARKADKEAVIIGALALRRGFLHRLPHWNTFGKGWDARLRGVQAEAIDMAKEPAKEYSLEAISKKYSLEAIFQAIINAIMRLFK